MRGGGVKRREKPLVLCVDDEVDVLEGLELHLRKRFKVRLAEGGAEGLAELERDSSFAIVMSDMRMPQMNGAEFLTKVREVAPEATRMLLTGQTDMESAITAVNEGQIFRFLTKPCPPDRLLAVFEAALEQYRLVTAEKELLEQTVHGSIKALTSLLGLTHPLAFGRATRLAQMVGEMCGAVQLEPRWPVEVAAMVSQLGSIALPEETAEKAYYGLDLTAREQKLVDSGPDTVRELLGNIPRLEPVLEILGATTLRKGAVPESLQTQVGMLKVALAYDVLIARGQDPDSALGMLRNRAKEHEPELVEALRKSQGGKKREEVREIPIAAVQQGMVFAEDVRTTSGTLLIARGFEVNASFVAKARGFQRGFVKDPVRVIVPPANSQP